MALVLLVLVMFCSAAITRALKGNH